MTMRRASKLCARRRLQIPNIFNLDPINRGTLGIIEPWPECQPEESRPREVRPEDSSICKKTNIYIYIYIYKRCVSEGALPQVCVSVKKQTYMFKIIMFDIV